MGAPAVPDRVSASVIPAPSAAIARQSLLTNACERPHQNSHARVRLAIGHTRDGGIAHGHCCPGEGGSAARLSVVIVVSAIGDAASCRAIRRERAVILTAHSPSNCDACRWV